MPRPLTPSPQESLSPTASPLLPFQLQPPKVPPNQARLIVTAESTLTFGDELGSGAFGTVYEVRVGLGGVGLEGVGLGRGIGLRENCQCKKCLHTRSDAGTGSICVAVTIVDSEVTVHVHPLGLLATRGRRPSLPRGHQGPQ